jgi:hypothetical protein
MLGVFSKIFGLGNLIQAILFPVLAILAFIITFRINKGILLAFLLLLSYILISSLFQVSSFNNGSLEYMLNQFILFALPGAFFLTLSINIKYINILTFFGILNLLVLIIFPIMFPLIYLDKEVFSYMTYGNYLIPSSVFFAYLWVHYGNKRWLFFFIISVLALVLFANRSAMLIAIISPLVVSILDKKKRVNVLKTYFILIGFLIISFSSVMILIENLLAIENNSLVGLARLYTTFLESSDVSSGRNVLWMESVNAIMNNPYGYGVFGYTDILLMGNEGLYKYPHNIFLQFYLEFGVIFGSILIASLLYLILKIKSFKVSGSENLQLILVSILCLRLMTSSSYLFDQYFIAWISLVFTFMIRKKININHARVN